MRFSSTGMRECEGRAVSPSGFCPDGREHISFVQRSGQRNGQDRTLFVLSRPPWHGSPASIILLSVVTAHQKRIEPLSLKDNLSATHRFPARCQRMSFNVVGSSTSFFTFGEFNSSALGIAFNFLIASASPVDVIWAAIGSPTLTRESIFVSGVMRR